MTNLSGLRPGQTLPPSLVVEAARRELERRRRRKAAALKALAQSLPALRQDQQEILDHPARVKVLAMGRRWGKTTLGGVLALTSAASGARVAWVAPTYRNTWALWRFCVHYATAPGVFADVRRGDYQIIFPATGGALTIYSADNDTALRGEGFDLVICDEAARLRAETIQDVIMPTLADREGVLWLISTPCGLNWFFTEYQRGLADGAYQASWRAPTSANPLPAIQRSYQLMRERMLRGEYPERAFRQEWEAEFVEHGGQVFRNVDALAVAARVEAPQPGHEYVAGVDWGRFGDATVFVVIDIKTKSVVYLDRMTDVPFALQLARLRGLQERFRCRVLVVERNAMGEPLVEELQAMGLPVISFMTTAASKAVLVEHLADALERGFLTLLNDPVLLNELKTFTAQRNASGYVSYGAQDGAHDDCVMALALAWHGARGDYAGPAIIEL